MNKLTIIMFFIIFLLFVILVPRMLEIYKPIKNKSISWRQLYDLKKLDKGYVAQGIEVYNNYLFYTVHKQEESSHLIVFKIKQNKSLEYFFTTDFPNIATHVSDLSIYNHYLYAIDYASHNLYKIDINKTLDAQTLIVDNVIQTNIDRSGSIIVTQYNNKDIILISQFLLNNYIQVFNLSDLNKKDKKSLFTIESKYFIQGLYKNNDYIYISSNTNNIDPIYITSETALLSQRNIDNPTTVILNSPGRMVEDIVVFDDYLITSDEETNKIYISQKKISEYRVK